MSSIRGMMKQARPDEEPPTEARRQTPAADPASPPGETRRPLRLPTMTAPEERKPFSTRVKPSLKKVLEAYTQEIREAGFAVTQELVLDVLLRELRENDILRERVAEVLVKEVTSNP